MFYSKLQGLLWSAADIVLILALLKMADWVRRETGDRKIRIRYVLLLLSALCTPLLVFSRTPKEFFYLEAVICGIQFLILIYTVLAEGGRTTRVVKGMLGARHDS